MIVFTILGLLWFWFFCFEVGYHLEPMYLSGRALVAIWLFGRKAERLAAYVAMTVGVAGLHHDTF